MQLTKLYAYSLSFPFSFSADLFAQGSLEVKDIDHTISRNTRYSWIYIFDYGMYRARLGSSIIEKLFMYIGLR